MGSSDVPETAQEQAAEAIHIEARSFEEEAAFWTNRAKEVGIDQAVKEKRAALKLKAS